MRGFVDRLEDGVAVVLLDGGGRAYINASLLPAGLAAGNIVEVTIARVDPPTDAGSVEEIAALIERLRSGEHRHG
ncbi:MAG: DUF3006 domain-containing protein [Armatimonadota bacterium]